jgi:hypothetical protein
VEGDPNFNAQHWLVGSNISEKKSDVVSSLFYH